MRLHASFTQLFLVFILAVITSFPLSICGQVTIGSNQEVNKASLLDLKETNGVINSKGGLMLPRVNLKGVNILTPDGGAYTEKDIHIGLFVYNLTNKKELCEGPYIWKGEKWQRLWAACPCEYKVTGWIDGKTYYVLCEEFKNISQSSAEAICKTAKNGDTSNTYHLLTDKEYTQIWSEKPEGEDENIFLSGNSYFLKKDSQTDSPKGWITQGNLSGENLNKMYNIMGVEWGQIRGGIAGGFFPGGAPIGGEFTNTTVRCVRN
ncbi:MAG: hypothetical protein E6767_07040 [Dysgonomonas sp.]|nr:hypothetical protein [Dysgonomonas sp.]